MSGDRWPEPCAQCGGNTPPFCRCLECGKRLHGIGACFERHKCLVDDEPEEKEGETEK